MGFPSLVGLIHLFRMPMKTNSVLTQSLCAYDVPYGNGCAKLTKVHSHVPSRYRNCINFLLAQYTILNAKTTRLCFAFDRPRLPIPAQIPYTLSVKCSFPQPLKKYEAIVPYCRK